MPPIPEYQSWFDAEMLADLNASQLHRRRGAISALADLLRDGNAAIQRSAKAALLDRLEQERDHVVRAELASALAARAAPGRGPRRGSRARDEKIRETALRIWEAEGCPQDANQEKIWLRAKAEVAANTKSDKV
jgi:hypothetical protein